MPRRGLGRRTNQCYAAGVARYAAFAGGEREAMEVETATRFLTSVVDDEDCAYSTEKQGWVRDRTLLSPLLRPGLPGVWFRLFEDRILRQFTDRPPVWGFALSRFCCLPFANVSCEGASVPVVVMTPGSGIGGTNQHE